MLRRNSVEKDQTHRDSALLLVALLGLAAPFIPLPGDQATRIAVHFRVPGMTRPGSFSTRTSDSICEVMAAVLTFNDQAKGDFARIDCGRQPDTSRAP